MERQKYSKPYMARFLLYRFFKKGTWRKYSYSLAGNYPWGWYWTQEDNDFACGSQLTKLKEQTF